MISQTVEYALRAIVTIAQHKGVPCTAQKIAEITQVPAPYLSKMMQGMARANLVVSKRGLHGGFVLTKDASQTTILDVIEAVEPFQRIRECPLGIGSHEVALCPLHRRLDNAMETVEASFREATIAELLAQPGSVSPLCDEGQMVTIDLGDSGCDTVTKTSTTRKTKQKKVERRDAINTWTTSTLSVDHLVTNPISFTRLLRCVAVSQHGVRPA